MACAHITGVLCQDLALLLSLNTTRKGVQYVWDEDYQQAFIVLKHALVQVPVLSYPDLELPYIFDTDTSQEGMGAVHGSHS